MGLTEAQIKGRLKSEAAKNQADARNLMRIYWSMNTYTCYC